MGMSKSNEAQARARASRERAGGIVAELWSNAPVFTDPAEFLEVLTETLDDLCSAYGKPLPGDFREIFGDRLAVAS